MNKKNHDLRTFEELKKQYAEVLEISSTGYGLESVFLDKAEEQQNKQKSSTPPPNCGGL
ncbi:hypothetical protein [Mesobacillus harenae]|uniref:hypothetical protein n=1 Tax=Mesobacillus harenae TaxID=2213203 RepID=UPI0015804CCA|nr:hypothetical protein [Mesobacillus harenae]